MAYNNENLLIKILRIQSIVMEHKKKGCTQKWIYENIIKPQFFISYPTYNRYLAINAKSELKKIENKSNIK